MELPTAPLGGGTACATPRATCVRKYQHGLDVFQEDVSSVSSLKPSLDGSRSRNEGRNDELLGVQGTEGAMRHAVDAPISVAMLVANGDGETAVVGPQQVDHLSGVVARERQRGALARVGRPVLPLFSCKKNKPNKTKKRNLIQRNDSLPSLLIDVAVGGREGGGYAVTATLPRWRGGLAHRPAGVLS